MLIKRLIVYAEPFAYAILFLLIIRRIVGNGLISLEQQAFEKTIYEMALWVLLTAIFLWIAHTKSIIPKMLSAWSKNWFVLVFILLAVCSIAWSSNRVVSVYKGISLIGCSVIAAYTALTYSNKTIFRGFWWFFIFVAISSFVLAVFFPSIGTQIGYPYYGAWRGIFWSKNYMGPIVAIGNLVFLFHIFAAGKKVLPLLGNILLYLLTALLVFLSKCASAMNFNGHLEPGILFGAGLGEMEETP